MLLLSFNLGLEQYAISAKQIIEILPLTSLKSIPKAPVYVAGLLDFRGLPVPVIDLCQLTNDQDYNKVLSSRIVLVNYMDKNFKNHTLGLIAEKVTEMLEIPKEAFSSSGISLKEMSYLGSVTNNEGKMIQYIEINELLTEEVQSMLFSDVSENKQAGRQ